MSRQGLYQRCQRQARQARAQADVAEAVVGQVRAVRIKLPRLGTRKPRHKIAPLLRAQGLACAPSCATVDS